MTETFINMLNWVDVNLLVESKAWKSATKSERSSCLVVGTNGGRGQLLVHFALF